MTAGMVSLMLGAGYCGFGYSGFFSLFFGSSCSRRRLFCLRVLLCVRVRRPRSFGFYGGGLLIVLPQFLGCLGSVLGVCVVFFQLCCTLRLVSYYTFLVLGSTVFLVDIH